MAPNHTAIKVGATWPDAPRLCPQRTFPPYRFVRGVNPHPTRDPRGHSYGQAEACESWAPEQWHENESYLYGIDLYHYGYLWESHEEWEGPWRSVARGTVAALFLQALILNSAAQIKARAGSVRGTRTRSQGAARRLEEALALCEGTGTRRFMGIDIQELIEQIERHYRPAWEPDVTCVRTDGPPPRLVPKFPES